MQDGSSEVASQHVLVSWHQYPLLPVCDVQLSQVLSGSGVGPTCGESGGGGSAGGDGGESSIGGGGDAGQVTETPPVGHLLLEES